MTDPQTAGILLTLLAMAAGGVWKLTRVEQALRKDITDSKDEIEAKHDQHSREFGETISALRQHVNIIQLEVADKYMRRDGFHIVKQEIEESMDKMGERLEKRLERMETKLDSKT